MILIAAVIYLAAAVLFVLSIAFVSGRPMPKPGDVNDQNNELLQAISQVPAGCSSP